MHRESVLGCGDLFGVLFQSVGQDMAVASVDASSALEFRYSPQRHLVGRIIAVLAMAATLAAVTALSSEPWWRVLRRLGCFGILGAA